MEGGLLSPSFKSSLSSLFKSSPVRDRLKHANKNLFFIYLRKYLRIKIRITTSLAHAAWRSLKFSRRIRFLGPHFLDVIDNRLMVAEMGSPLGISHIPNRMWSRKLKGCQLHKIDI